MTNNCANCILMQNNFCQVFHQEIQDKENTCCPKYCNTPSRCDICHNVFAGESYLMPLNDRYYTICEKCQSESHHCPTCICGGECEFETNSSSLPKQVQKEIRQGNQIMITTIQNPERVKITCEAGCKCYNKEIGCLKQNGMCEQHKLPIEEK